MTKRGADDFQTEDESTDRNGAKELAVSKAYVSPVKAAAESSHGISPSASPMSPTRSLLSTYHSPSSSSSGGEYSHGNTVVMKVHQIAEFCLVKFQIPKNATQDFLSAAAAWFKPTLVHIHGNNYLANQKDARLEGQFFQLKDHGQQSSLTAKLASRFNYENLKSRLSNHGGFVLENADVGCEIEKLLPISLMIIWVIHVYTTVLEGVVYLRFAFVGDAGWSLKSEVQSVLSTSFGVEMKWDGELWSNVKSIDLEFDKVQAISDYVLSLGCNYKKNVTKLSEEMLSKIPHFLSNVQSE